MTSRLNMLPSNSGSELSASSQLQLTEATDRDSSQLSQYDSTSEGPSESPSHTSVEDLQLLVSSIGDNDGVVFIDATYNYSANHMFDYLFTDSDFYRSFLKSRNMTNLDLGEWEDPTSATAIRERTISYMFMIKSMLYRKQCKTVEKQSIHAISEPGRLFVVDTEVVNHGAPFSNSFYVFIRFCICQVTDASCSLRISSRPRYTKSVNSLVKDIIDRECTSGLREHFSRLAEKLRVSSDECYPRHATGAQIQDGSDSPGPAFILDGSVEPPQQLDEEFDSLQEQSEPLFPLMGNGEQRENMESQPHIFPQHRPSYSHSTSQKSYQQYNCISIHHLAIGLLFLVFIETLLVSYTYMRILRIQELMDNFDNPNSEFSTSAAARWTRLIESERHLHRDEIAKMEKAMETMTSLMEEMLADLRKFESALKQHQIKAKTQTQ